MNGSDLGKLEVIRSGLQGVSLPPLRRPSTPGAAPTKELIDWCTCVYASSSIAHFRTVLSGLLALLDCDNEATAFLACRHLYEWTMHAAYVKQECTSFYQSHDWLKAFDMFSKVESGNSWIKKHGSKYAPELSVDELPTQLRINKFVSAYEAYQRSFYGSDGDDVQDTYGLLSEHSHPNGSCFLSYRRIVAGEYVFGPNEELALPHPLPYVLDWLVCINGILALPQERIVRGDIGRILKKSLRTTDEP